MLARNAGFSLVAVLSLAIGIGANCAVFSFTDTLLLRPLTVPRPSEVLTVGLNDTYRDTLIASYRDYTDIRERATSFQGLVGFTTAVVAFAADPAAQPGLRIGMITSGNLFEAMRVQPEVGRPFGPDEDQVPGRDAVLVLGHEFWTREFGADPAVLGRKVRLNGTEFTVIGVAPREFSGLDQYTRFEFYVPLMMWPALSGNRHPQPLEARDFRSLTIKGRLKPDATIAQARAELAVIARDLERAYPETNHNRTLGVRTELQLRVMQAPPIAALAAMLAALSAAVLLVACANVAGLLASRAPTRAREIALRLAIGAGRARVIRQLVTESLLIAAIGGVLGLGVGYAGITLFRQVRIPTELPISAAFELDRRALLVSIVAAAVSVALFGLAPAFRSTRAGLTTVMKTSDAVGLERRRRLSIQGRGWLVVAQVAISVTLLVVATFMFRGFRQRLDGGPGFRTDQLLMMTFDPSVLGYSEAQARRFFEQAAERARLAPGIRSAALTSYMPMDGVPPSVTVVPEGFQFPPGSQSETVSMSSVDSWYFETFAIPILRGRRFQETDSLDGPSVAIVNERFAQQYWPSQDPIGKRFRTNDGNGPWVEIVGLARNSKYSFITETPRPFVYMSYKQHPRETMFLVVEAVADPLGMVAPMRELIHGLDANMPLFNVRTVDDFYRMRVVTILNVISLLIGALGVMGLLLAIFGLYGLVAYAAGRRTREIGIRMAVGAARTDVLRMVLRQGMVLALIGLAAGLVLSAGADRALDTLFAGGPGGDGRTDPTAYVLVAGTVLAVTLVAAFIPARRASRINPTEALRSE